MNRRIVARAVIGTGNCNSCAVVERDSERAAVSALSLRDACNFAGDIGGRETLDGNLIAVGNAVVADSGRVAAVDKCIRAATAIEEITAAVAADSVVATAAADNVIISITGELEAFSRVGAVNRDNAAVGRRLGRVVAFRRRSDRDCRAVAVVKQAVAGEGCTLAVEVELRIRAALNDDFTCRARAVGKRQRESRRSRAVVNNRSVIAGVESFARRESLNGHVAAVVFERILAFTAGECAVKSSGTKRYSFRDCRGVDCGNFAVEFVRSVTCSREQCIRAVINLAVAGQLAALNESNARIFSKAVEFDGVGAELEGRRRRIDSRRSDVVVAD